MIARVGWARSRVANLLTDTATLIRVTSTSDDTGGTTRTETTLGVYPFRLQTTNPLTGTTAGREQTSADRIAALQERVGFLPYGTDVQAADIVEHQTRRWEVAAVVDDRTDGVTVGVLLKRVG